MADNLDSLLDVEWNVPCSLSAPADPFSTGSRMKLKSKCTTILKSNKLNTLITMTTVDPDNLVSKTFDRFSTHSNNLDRIPSPFPRRFTVSTSFPEKRKKRVQFSRNQQIFSIVCHSDTLSDKDSWSSPWEVSRVMNIPFQRQTVKAQGTGNESNELSLPNILRINDSKNSNDPWLTHDCGRAGVKPRA